MAYTNSDGIIINDKPEEWLGMRSAGKLASSVLDMISKHVAEGVTPNYLNDLCHEMIIKAGATPAPLHYAGGGYNKITGFPKSVCTSVNNVVCHGIPDDKPLRDGDIINIDVTVILDGWHGDTSRMFCVGKPSIKAQRLIDITYDAMMHGIDAVKPGEKIWRIGEAIENYVKSKSNYGIVTEYCGHGLGKIFHTAPSILHYKNTEWDITMEEGMFFTIEPMLNIGKAGTKLSKADGWTVTTKDRSLSAQFEHSLGVTADGYEIFT